MIFKNNSLRICVFGAGAVGSVVASRLAAAGREVTVVARGARLEQVTANGLQLRAPNGNVSSFNVVARSAAEAGLQDIVFVALKAKDIPAALPQILGLAGPKTCIVPLVNGVPWWYRQPGNSKPISSVDPDGLLAATIEPAQLVGAVLFLTCALADDGIVDVRGNERIVMGPVIPGDMAHKKLLGEIFEGCSIATQFVPDVRRDLWGKVALNLASNPLSVATDATLEQQFHSDGLAPVVLNVLEETCALAQAMGVEPRLTVAEMNEFGKRAGPFYTSMAQDYRRGNALELGAICQSIFELADEMGVQMPVAQTIYEICRFRAEARAA